MTEHQCRVDTCLDSLFSAVLIQALLLLCQYLKERLNRCLGGSLVQGRGSVSNGFQRHTGEGKTQLLHTARGEHMHECRRSPPPHIHAIF